MRGKLEFRVLGPLEVRHDGRDIHLPPRERALLSVLLMRSNELVPVSELIDALWGDSPPTTAQAALKNAVSSLRKSLPARVIETRPSGYVLHAEPGELDVLRFESLVREARGAPAPTRADLLRAALAQWRGLPLAEVPVEPYVRTEIVRLEELRMLALEDRIEADLALGHDAELVPELESMVQRHPLRERLWGQLMLAMYRAGRQAEALATYRRAHAALVEELAIEPGPALKDLQRAILVQDPRLDEVEGMPRDELIDRIAPLLPTDDRRRARAVYEYGVALWLLGERDRSEAALEHAATVAAGAGDPSLEELARLRISWQQLFTRRASPTAHLARARLAIRVFEELGDDSSLAHALSHEAHMLRDLGHATEAASAFARGADLAHASGDSSHESFCRDLICGTFALGPMPVQQAIERCEAEIAAVERQGHLTLWGWWSLGLLYAQNGDSPEGLALFERAETACRDVALWNQLALTSFYRSWVYELVDDSAGAVRELRSTFEQCTAVADRGMRQLVAGRLARALAVTGALEEAEELARSASKAASSDNFLEQTAWRQGLALVLSRRRRHAAARRAAGEAVELASRSDWLNLHAETLEDLAAVETAAERSGAASSALEEAIALYERKGNVVAAARARQRFGTGHEVTRL